MSELNDSLKSILSGSILKNKPSTSPCRRVSFESVDVREYDRTVGDNPSCRSGPPLSLDWQYSSVPTRNIDDFELERCRTRVSHKSKLHVNKHTRRNILCFQWGLSEEELKKSVRQVKQVRRQRALTDAFMLVHLTHEVCVNIKSVALEKLNQGRNKSQPTNFGHTKLQGESKHKRQHTDVTLELFNDDDIIESA